MYIVAIGWLYVTILIAANEPTFFAGVVSFLFYGLLPCSLLLWLGNSKSRRQRRRYRESVANQGLNQHDRGDSERDQ